MSSKLRPDVIVNGEVAESRNDVALKTPSLAGHSPPLHENANFFADSIGKNEPPRLFAGLAQRERGLDRLRFRVVERGEERVLRDAEGQEELRLAIEKQRGGAE